MFRKLVSGFLCVVLLAVGLCALASGEERIIVDRKGREIRLSAAVERVVALTPADCEILYALGAQDVLVGRGMDCNYPQDLLEIPVVNSGETTNIEQILALDADYVLMNTMGQTVQQVQALEAAGIQVVVTDTTDIAGVYDGIALIGALLGKEDAAQSIVLDMKASFAEISAQSAVNEGKTVYFEVSPLEYGLWTAGNNTFFNELAALCGLKNIFSDVDGWAEVSQEQVIARNPDYIVTIFPGNGSGISSEEEIKARVGWESIQAIQNGNVMLADADEASRPGPRLVQAAQHLLDFVQKP